MNFQQINTYGASSKVDAYTSWVTDPNVPDPQHLPEPLGWTLLVRPYPVTQNRKNSKLYLPDSEIDFLNHLNNVARVVAIGPCAFNRQEHRMKDGSQKDWVSVGDFVTFPKNTGARRNFKGVSFVLLNDDEVVERLRDPLVLADESYYTVNIPKEHLEKYNTIYNKDFKQDV